MGTEVVQEMPKESVKTHISVYKMGRVPPVWASPEVERVLVAVIDVFGVKSKADFTMRKSLHLLLKFLSLKISFS